MEQELKNSLASDIDEIFNDNRLFPSEKRGKILKLIKRYEDLDEMRKSLVRLFVTEKKKQKQDITEEILLEHPFLETLGLIATLQMMQLMFPKEKWIYIPTGYQSPFVM